MHLVPYIEDISGHSDQGEGAIKQLIAYLNAPKEGSTEPISKTDGLSTLTIVDIESFKEWYT